MQLQSGGRDEQRRFDFEKPTRLEEGADSSVQQRALAQPLRRQPLDFARSGQRVSP
jgi:hypothetical protein